MIPVKFTSSNQFFKTNFICQQFELKNLGNLNFFLGLKITSSPKDFYLIQAKYAFELLSEVGLINSKITNTDLTPCMFDPFHK